MKKVNRELSRWFVLTKDEARLVAVIAGVLVVGLAARYWHLKNEKPAPFEPSGVGVALRGEAPSDE